MMEMMPPEAMAGMDDTIMPQQATDPAANDLENEMADVEGNDVSGWGEGDAMSAEAAFEGLAPLESSDNLPPGGDPMSMGFDGDQPGATGPIGEANTAQPSSVDAAISAIDEVAAQTISEQAEEVQNTDMQDIASVEESVDEPDGSDAG